MPVKWFEGEVVKIIALSQTIRHFFIEIKDEEPFEYQAGQFVTFDLPVSDKRLQRWRSYSIANRASSSNVLEFCIVHLDDGLGSGYFFEEVKIGSKLKFKGPDGAFVLKYPIEQDLVLLCTGTGVAPFKAMLDDLFHEKRAFKNIHLIFGTRTEENIIYRSEFEAYEKEFPNFTYDIVLSKAPKWGGREGHIHQVYLEKYGTARPDVKFMICGWSKMIDEAVENLLLKCQYDSALVQYELYG